MLHAGYGMVDAKWFERLRLIAGARAEVFTQNIEASSPYATNQDVVAKTERTDFDPLPSASVVWEMIKAMNLRLSYGGTIARPLVRELSPFLNQDFIRRRNIQGNPDLDRTYIHNFDVRWEYFLAESEVLAVSFFAKLFEDPIEPIILDVEGNLTYQNIQSAENFGAEFEARMSFGRLTDVLDAFSLTANLALIRSSVSLSPEELSKATNPERPLAGQSPYVANVSIGYAPEKLGVSAFLFYNVFGKRLVEVGSLGLPDVYELPLHSLDFTAFYKFDASWTLSASVQNILNQEVRFEQGGFDFRRFTPGVTFGLRMGWQY